MTPYMKRKALADQQTAWRERLHYLNEMIDAGMVTGEDCMEQQSLVKKLYFL